MKVFLPAERLRKIILLGVVALSLLLGAFALGHYISKLASADVALSDMYADVLGLNLVYGVSDGERDVPDEIFFLRVSLWEKQLRMYRSNLPEKFIKSFCVEFRAYDEKTKRFADLVSKGYEFPMIQRLCYR